MLAALHQGIAALSSLVLRLAGIVLAFQELAVLLVDEGLDLRDLVVDVADLGHLGLVVLAFAVLQQRFALPSMPARFASRSLYFLRMMYPP